MSTRTRCAWYLGNYCSWSKRCRPAFQLILALAFSSSATCALADELARIPETLNGPDYQLLLQKRAELLSRRDNLSANIAAHDAKCAHIREDSVDVAYCEKSQLELLSAAATYNSAVAAFDRLLDSAMSRLEQRRSCEAAKKNAVGARQEIELIIRETGSSQNELAEWSRRSEEAKRQAVLSGVRYVLSEYGATANTTRAAVRKFSDQIEYLARRSATSQGALTQLKYAQQLRSAAELIGAVDRSGVLKPLANAASGVDEAWSVARNSLRYELRVAQKRNVQLRELLMATSLNRGILGSDIDTPGLDVLSDLAQKASEEAAKSSLALEEFEEFVGPTVRASVFVRDAAYSATLALLSAERVTQANDVAGELANASEVLQAKYRKDIDALKACESSKSADSSARQ